MANSGSQFGRTVGLFLGNGVNAIDVSDLHFKFTVEGADVETPNIAIIRIYNLAKATRDRIINEFDKIILQAGYETANYGVIFSGQIKSFKKGKENNTDTFLEIAAADGDLGYNFGYVNTTLGGDGGGASMASILQKNAEALGANIDPNAAAYASTGGVLPRGKVLFGLARTYIRQMSETLDCRWSQQNGNLVFVKNTGYLPGDIVVVNSETGMVGVPESTDNGINVTMLLNPSLRIGGRIQINNSDIVQILGTVRSPARLGLNFPNYNSLSFPADVTEDGIYRIMVCNHQGDTRGTEYYSQVTCLAVDPSSPPLDSVKLY